MGIIPFIERAKVLALFPFFGAIVAAYEFTGVANDGSISISGTSIISASLSSGTWQAAVLMPLSITVIDFLLCGYVAVKR